MSNKRYSNKGVNSAAKAQANAAAAQENKRQTLIICIVAAAVILLAIVLAIVLGGTDSTVGGNKETTPNANQTTTAPTADPNDPNDIMTAIKTEIDSKTVADFTETDKPSNYVRITIKHYGDVVVRLRPDIAPITVANFQKLVGKGFYDGLTFHRIVRGFMIQGGDPKGDGTGGSGTTIKGEFMLNGVQNDLSHVAGVISMARLSTPYDSATSQFFICNDDAAANSLDGKYAAFGYVVAGLDVVLTVSEVPLKPDASATETSTPVTPVVIEKICFVTEN